MALTKEQEIEMYGETVEEMRAAPLFTRLDDPLDLTMYAMQIMSDAQEALARGQAETARQWINKAKYFICEARTIMRQKERAG